MQESTPPTQHSRPPLLGPKAKTSTIEDYLYNILEVYGSKDDTYWLDIRPVGFMNGEQRRNWRTFSDTQGLLTFAEWATRWNYTSRAPVRQYPTLIGFFCTWAASWVGLTARKWKKEPWHAWAAVLITTPGRQGKDLVIWDCNGFPEGKERRVNNLLGQQKNLVRVVKKYGSLKTVWFGGSGNRRGGICVQLTADWIESICSRGGLGEKATWVGQGLQELRL